MLYKRGNVWWYKFRFEGQVIRDSAKTTSKTVARDAERARRRDLELGVNRITKRERMPLFKVAAEQWLATKKNLSRFSDLHYKQYKESLTACFGSRLVCDIDLEDIAALQDKRREEGKGNRAINAEIGALRQILKHYGLWSSLAGRVRFLREPHDTGRAISHEDETRLLESAGRSRSPALLPRLVLALDTGIRANEMRQLRHRDLKLVWRDGTIERGWLTVSKSKTEGGTGRTIPLSGRVCAVLTLWQSRFPNAGPDAYLFPRHKVGFATKKGQPEARECYLYEIDLNRPAAEWKSSWQAALQAAKLHYRWHDLRHTFVSRVAENPAVSEQTIMSLAGHVSKSMLARYSHIRTAAKEAAIATLERETKEPRPNEIPDDGAQNWAQSDANGSEPRDTISEEALN
jgi:integrase